MPCSYPSPGKVFLYSQPGCYLSSSSHLISESFQPTGRIYLPLTWVCRSLPTKPPCGVGHQLSWERKDHLLLSEDPCLRQAETEARVQLSLYPLHGGFFLFYQHVVPLAHHPELSSHPCALTNLCPISASCWLPKHNLLI